MREAKRSRSSGDLEDGRVIQHRETESLCRGKRLDGRRARERPVEHYPRPSPREGHVDTSAFGNLGRPWLNWHLTLVLTLAVYQEEVESVTSKASTSTQLSHEAGFLSDLMRTSISWEPTERPLFVYTGTWPCSVAS